MTEPKKKKKGSFLSTFIPLVLLFAGIGLMAYPTVSDAWNTYFQSRALIRYADNISAMNQEEYDRLLGDALDYNRRRAEKGMPWFLEDEEKEEYLQTLKYEETGIMGYIEIPSINVRLSILHGTDPDTLQTSVGHLEETSVPVGAYSWDEELGRLTDPLDGSHCILSGHRGLPSARLFTDLDMLKEGDTFTLNVLSETATYQVDQIRIVLPDDFSELMLIPGMDICTLVTCTPYGVNSHRLLVRGHRIQNAEEEHKITVSAEAIQISEYVIALGVGIPMLFLFLLGILIRYRRRPAKPAADELLRDLSELVKRQDQLSFTKANTKTNPERKESADD